MATRDGRGGTEGIGSRVLAHGNLMVDDPLLAEMIVVPPSTICRLLDEEVSSGWPAFAKDCLNSPKWPAMWCMGDDGSRYCSRTKAVLSACTCIMLVRRWFCRTARSMWWVGRADESRVPPPLRSWNHGRGARHRCECTPSRCASFASLANSRSTRHCPNHWPSCSGSACLARSARS